MRKPAWSRLFALVMAAAALSAAFNTPVAAVLFALEEIIGDMNASLIGSTVVASVTAVIVERSILGNEPLFRSLAKRNIRTFIDRGVRRILVAGRLAFGLRGGRFLLALPLRLVGRPGSPETRPSCPSPRPPRP